MNTKLTQIFNGTATPDDIFDSVFFTAQALVKSHHQKKSTAFYFGVLEVAAKQVSMRDLDPMIRAWMAVCKIDGTALYDFACKANTYPEFGAEIIVGLAKLHIREKDKGYRKRIHRLIFDACRIWLDNDFHLDAAA